MTESSKTTAAKLYTDGGSRGNPGQSAGAFVICKLDDSVVETTGFYLGVMTNNQAEYKALARGLERCLALDIKKLDVFMDSELVVKQLNGLYKVKNIDIKPLYELIRGLVSEFEQISFTHILRAKNSLADKELNRVLDEKTAH